MLGAPPARNPQKCSAEILHLYSYCLSHKDANYHQCAVRARQMVMLPQLGEPIFPYDINSRDENRRWTISAANKGVIINRANALLSSPHVHVLPAAYEWGCMSISNDYLLKRWMSHDLCVVCQSEKGNWKILPYLACYTMKEECF